MARLWRHRYRERVLSLLVLALTVDYADRMLLGAFGPTIEATFHLDAPGLGVLAAAFGIVGAGATLPVGVLTDRVKRTMLLAASLGIWAAAAAWTGAATSFVMLFGSRMLLGVLAATTGPTSLSLIGDLVPAGRRGQALGLLDSGQLIGSGVGLALAAVVTQFLSWRWGFWLLAAVSVGLTFRLLRAPEPARSSGPDAGRWDDCEASRRGSAVHQLAGARSMALSTAAVPCEAPTGMSLWAVAAYVIRVRTNLIVLAGRAVGDYFLAGVSTFAAVFASTQYHLSQGAADLALLALGGGALGGVLLAGRLADALLRRGWINGSVWLASLGNLLAPIPLLPALLTHTVWIALPLFGLAAFLLAGAQPPLDAMRVNVQVPSLRGRAEAIRQLLRTAVEGGAPLAFGLLAASLAGGPAGLQCAFIVSLPLLSVSGLILLLALRTYPPDVAAVLVAIERDGARTRH
jgi:predicted MFS family arabinose efflux permease